MLYPYIKREKLDLKHFICPYCQEELRAKYDVYCPYCGALIDLSSYQIHIERNALLYREAQTAIAQQKWRLATKNLMSILSEEPNNTQVKELLAEARHKEKLERFYIQGHLHFYYQRWNKAINYYRKIKLIQPGYRDVDTKLDTALSNLKQEVKVKPRKILIVLRDTLLLIGLLIVAIIVIGIIIYFTFF